MGERKEGIDYPEGRRSRPLIVRAEFEGCCIHMSGVRVSRVRRIG